MLTHKGVVRNDRQFREMHFYHHIDRHNPRAEIEVEPMVAQQPDMLEGVPKILGRELAEHPF